MTQFTHEITRMERSETKGSRSPMWRCSTRDGQKVNVFSHSDPAKDNTALFKGAGYWPEMEALKVGESLEWTQHSIWVTMRQVDGWWVIDEVLKRGDVAAPDSRWQPNLAMYRLRAQHQADSILRTANLRIFDLETTGLNPDDELVSIAILNVHGETVFERRVKPAHPEKLLRSGKNGLSASVINGILPEDLAGEESFADLYPLIKNALHLAPWVVYNAKFDPQVLDRECSNAGFMPLVNTGIFDVALMAAEYLSNWNEKRQWFEMLTLEDAALELVGGIGQLHDAANDAQTTLLILESMMRGEKPHSTAGDVPF